LAGKATTANSSAGIFWRTLKWVLAFALSLFLLLALALYLLRASDYQQALVWSADHFLDAQLEFEGEFSLELGRKIYLRTQAVNLQANDGSYKLSIAEMDVQQDLIKSLLTETLILDSLNVSDMRLDVFASDDATSFDVTSLYLLPVVLADVKLHNISFVYKEKKRQDKIHLKYLVFDKNDKSNPVKISADGIVNKQTFKLKGSLGSLQQFRQMKNDHGHGQQHDENPYYQINFILSDNRSADAASGKAMVKVGGKLRDTPSGGMVIEATVDVSVAELARFFDPELKIEKFGQWQGDLSVTRLAGRWDIKKLHLVSSATDMYQLRVDGQVDELFAGRRKDRQLKLQLEMDVPDVKTFASQFDVALNGYAPFKTKGKLSGNADQLDYQGKSSIGRIESDIELSLSLSESKPLLTGKLTIPELYLVDIGIRQKLNIQVKAPVKKDKAKDNKPAHSVDVYEVTEEDEYPEDKVTDEEEYPVDKDDARRSAEVKQKLKNADKPKQVIADKQYVFDRKPLNLRAYQNFNMELDVSIDQITGVDYSINALLAHISLKDGMLRLSPLRLIFASGETNATFTLDARETPEFNLKVKADNLVLGDLMSKVQDQVPIKGKTNLHIDIKASGDSAHALASDLTGLMGFELEAASIPRVYIDYLSADVLGWALSKVTFSDAGYRFNCVMVNFDIAQGVAKSTVLLADGPRLLVNGITTLNLQKETIDMMLKPEKKKGFYSKVSAVKIKGPLMDPDVSSVSDHAAATAIGAVALVPVVAIPAYIFDKLLKNTDADKAQEKGCAALIAKEKAKKESQKTIETED
jgi:hypothetical protein